MDNNADNKTLCARLRGGGYPNGAESTMLEAADRIEKLEQEVTEWEEDNANWYLDRK